MLKDKVFDHCVEDVGFRLSTQQDSCLNWTMARPDGKRCRLVWMKFVKKRLTSEPSHVGSMFLIHFPVVLSPHL